MNMSYLILTLAQNINDSLQRTDGSSIIGSPVGPNWVYVILRPDYFIISQSWYVPALRRGLLVCPLPSTTRIRAQTLEGTVLLYLPKEDEYEKFPSLCRGILQQRSKPKF